MTLAEINADIAKYESARDKALSAQAYSMSGRSLTRANLEFIEKKLTELRQARDRMEAGGGVYVANMRSAD